MALENPIKNLKKLSLIKDEPSFSNGYSAEDDAFNHDAFASVLLDVIKDNDPPLTLGLFGDWGVGKSSIINQLRNKCSNEKVSLIYFNAWKYSEDSFRREFLIAVAESEKIIKKDSLRKEKLKRLERLNHAGIETQQSPKFEISKGGVGLALINVGFIGMLFISAMLISRFKGLLPAEVAGYSIGAAGFLSAVIATVFKQINQIFTVKVDNVVDPQLLFPEQFSKEFHKLIQHAQKDFPAHKVVIVVDDLDRCDSNTIKNILTTLKTFLGDENCIFIVPLDDSSIVQIFEKENANHGYEQLRKYFSVSVRIPTIHKQDLILFAKKIAEKHGIPADVPYIAALGFCRDARKMKHFLNMYKLKLALANTRAESKFLSNVAVKEIEKQLAKIVVLEYQFPEFHKVISNHPDALEVFTIAARGGDLLDGRAPLLREINPDLKDLNGLWSLYPGLKEFLSVTYDITLENFDILAKLKTSKQEAELGEFGLKLRKAIDASSTEGFALSLEAGYINSNGESIVDALESYFDENFTVPTQRAINVSLQILESNHLADYWQTRLFSSYSEIATRKSLGYKCGKKDVDVILSNLARVNHRQKVTIIAKVKEDAFDKNKVYPFDEIINHETFKLILSIDSSIVSHIDETIKHWFEKAETSDIKKDIAQRILNISYSLQDRQSNKINFPSSNLLESFVKAISQEDAKQEAETRDLFAKVVLDKRNPIDFKLLIKAVSEKTFQIFESNINDYKFNKTLTLGCSIALQIPEWLQADYAFNIYKLIAKHYQNFPLEAIHQLVLTLIVCHKSIADEQQKEQCLNQYNTVIDSFHFNDLSAHLKKIDQNFDEQEMQPVKSIILNQRWNKVKRHWNAPDENIVGSASVCRQNKHFFDQNAYKEFLRQLMTLSLNAHITLWSPFLLEAVKELDIADKIILIDAGFERLKDSATNQDTRLTYGNLTIGMLDALDKKSGKERFAIIFSWLSSDDAILRDFSVKNYGNLKKKYGDQVPKSQANAVLNTILDKANLVSFEQSIAIVREFDSSLDSSVWYKIASRINAELFDFAKHIAHRGLLLDLGAVIKDAGANADQLAQTLFTFKETGDNDSLKGKSWEIYELLLKNKRIREYAPSVDKT